MSAVFAFASVEDCEDAAGSCSSLEQKDEERIREPQRREEKEQPAEEAVLGVVAQRLLETAGVVLD